MNIPLKLKDSLFAAFAGAGTFGVIWLSLLIGKPFALSLAGALLVTGLVLVVLAIYRKYERVGTGIEGTYKQLEGLVSILNSLEIDRPLPPMRDWAVSVDLAHIIISNVFLHRPQNVLELGSGISTLLTGYCLKKLGSGKVWAVDHDENFAQVTERAIKAHGLEGHAEVIYAPLREEMNDGRSSLWYDRTFLKKLPRVDLVVVDGPPSHLGEMMRYPALPNVYPIMNEDGLLILDDAHREQEREVVRSWLSKFPDFECELVDTEKGTAILRRKRRNN